MNLFRYWFFVIAFLVTSLNAQTSSNELGKLQIVSFGELKETIDLALLTEKLDTSKSSFLNGARYYSYGDKGFLVLTMKDKEYVFKDIERRVWEDFKKSESFGKFYNTRIRPEARYKINLPITIRFIREPFEEEMEYTPELSAKIDAEYEAEISPATRDIPVKSQVQTEPVTGDEVPSLTKMPTSSGTPSQEIVSRTLKFFEVCNESVFSEKEHVALKKVEGRPRAYFYDREQGCKHFDCLRRRKQYLVEGDLFESVQTDLRDILCARFKTSKGEFLYGLLWVN